MPMHPSAPDDLSGLVDAYAHTTQAVIDLASTLSPGDESRPTDCPGWTVHDQVAHIAAAEAAMAGQSDPVVDVPAHPWIRNDVGRRTQMGIEVRRATPLFQVVTELTNLRATRLEQLRAGDVEMGTEVDDILQPGGRVPLGRALRFRIMDIWCHEQDIRTALGRAGNLDSPAACVFVASVLGMLGSIVVDVARVAPGHVVILEMTGPIVARRGVRVDAGPDGAAQARLMFTGKTDDTGSLPVVGEPEPVITSLHLSTEAFARRAAGRRSVDDTHVTTTGDPAVSRAVVEALCVTP